MYGTTQKEHRSSQPFIVVTSATTGALPASGARGEEARRREVELGPRDRRRARELLGDERGKLGHVVRTDDEIDVLDALEQPLALLLRDAARDGDDQRRGSAA